MLTVHRIQLLCPSSNRPRRLQSISLIVPPCHRSHNCRRVGRQRHLHVAICPAHRHRVSLRWVYPPHRMVWMCPRPSSSISTMDSTMRRVDRISSPHINPPISVRPSRVTWPPANRVGGIIIRVEMRRYGITRFPLKHTHAQQLPHRHTYTPLHYVKIFFFGFSIDLHDVFCLLLRVFLLPTSDLAK